MPAITSNIQPVREAVSYRGLFTAGWFGVREKHCSRLEIYDRLRGSEQAANPYEYMSWVQIKYGSQEMYVHFKM